MKPGDNAKLVATVLPENNTDNGVKLKWSTSDESVAKVDQNGNVTAIEDGTAVISVTATSSDGKSFTANCTVNVTSNYRIVLTHVDAGKFNPVLQFTYKVYKNNSEINNYSKFVIAGLEVGPKDYTISASRVNSEPSTATLILANGTKIEKVPVTYE